MSFLNNLHPTIKFTSSLFYIHPILRHRGFSQRWYTYQRSLHQTHKQTPVPPTRINCAPTIFIPPLTHQKCHSIQSFTTHVLLTIPLIFVLMNSCKQTNVATAYLSTNEKYSVFTLHNAIHYTTLKLNIFASS